MPLTDTRVRNSGPKEKPFKLTDGGGLYLEVKPTGSKLWRLRYRLVGKENLFAIGPNPEVGLAEARAERDRAKKLIKDGVHPSHQRKLDNVRKRHAHANTFEAVAQEWLERNKDKWTHKTYQQRERALSDDVYPHNNTQPIRQATPAVVLDIIQRVEKRAPTMAVIVNQAIGAIFRYAVATLRADSDPTPPLRGALKPYQAGHHKPLARAEIPAF